jgi:hypothetical protein
VLWLGNEIPVGVFDNDIRQQGYHDNQYLHLERMRERMRERERE